MGGHRGGHGGGQSYQAPAPVQDNSAMLAQQQAAAKAAADAAAAAALQKQQQAEYQTRLTGAQDVAKVGSQQAQSQLASTG